MKEENVKAVQALREKIRAKEEEARQLKIVVNGFFTDEGEDPPYPGANTANAASIGALRTDHFYGKTMAEAAQLYLEMRKASGHGSASVNEIYSALKSGGYEFETKSEAYAKNGVRISLRKNPTVFHQLPGGDYGLRVWYGVKVPKEESKSPKKKTQRRKRSAKAADDSALPTVPPQESNGQHPIPDKRGGNRKTSIKVLESK